MNEDGAHTSDATAAALFEVLLEASPDAVAVVRGRSLWRANAALLRLFGYEATDSLFGRPWTSLFVPEDRPGLHALGERGSATPRLVRGLRRDGNELPIEVRVHPHVVSGQSHLVVILRALDRPSEKQRAIREREALYRAIFEVNTAVKLLIEPGSGRIVDANRTAVAFYGWPLETLRAMKIQDINVLAKEEVEAEMERARSRRRNYFRFTHRVASGAERHVEVHSGPVDLGGETLLLSIIHDVTERDAFEEQLMRARRLETVGRLAGGVAHDFNNLLTVIMTASGVVARQLEEGTVGSECLRDLDHAAQRGAELTQQLLSVGRRQVMRARVLGLDELVRGMEGLLRRTLGPQYDVRVDVGAEVPPVEVDAGRIEQVVLNLVLNARDAMPEGGQLTIRTRAVTIGENDPLELAPGTYAALAVEDTGEGMDEHTRAHVFDPFFTTRAEGGGTGLGLSSAYGIIRQSRGDIDVRSRPGGGSTFEILLPATHAVKETDAEPEPSETPAHDVRGGRVLLVEDAPDVRKALRIALEGAGYVVEVAASSEEALARRDAALASLDVCVSDVRLQGASGVELAHALRDRRADLPILLVTGDPSEHLSSSIPDGVAVLRKPFRNEELVRAVAECRRTPSAAD